MFFLVSLSITIEFLAKQWKPIFLEFSFCSLSEDFTLIFCVFFLLSSSWSEVINNSIFWQEICWWRKLFVYYAKTQTLERLVTKLGPIWVSNGLINHHIIILFKVTDTDTIRMFFIDKEGWLWKFLDEFFTTHDFDLILLEHNNWDWVNDTLHIFIHLVLVLYSSLSLFIHHLLVFLLDDILLLWLLLDLVLLLLLFLFSGLFKFVQVLWVCCIS